MCMTVMRCRKISQCPWYFTCKSCSSTALVVLYINLYINYILFFLHLLSSMCGVYVPLSALFHLSHISKILLYNIPSRKPSFFSLTSDFLLAFHYVLTYWYIYIIFTFAAPSCRLHYTSALFLYTNSSRLKHIKQTHNRWRRLH